MLEAVETESGGQSRPLLFLLALGGHLDLGQFHAGQKIDESLQHIC
jgi:hypothetical protein